MRNARHALLSSRCDWCRRIWTGKEWLSERRPEGREIYNHGICNECMAIHFTGSWDKEQMKTMRVRLVPIRLGH